MKSGLTGLLPPTNVSATVTTNQITLSWTDNSSNEEGFHIEVSAGPNAADPWVQLDTVAAGVTTFNHTGLQPGRRYRYRIVAHNDGDAIGTPCAVIEATTLAPTPANLTATAVGTTRINLNWDDNAESNLAGYHVYRSTTPDFTPAPSNRIATLVTTSAYSDTSPPDGGRFYYKVTAVDDVSYGSAATPLAGQTVESAASNVATATLVIDLDILGLDDVTKLSVGRYVMVNFDHDENNHDQHGNPLDDNEPDATAGHRINVTDQDLQNGTITIAAGVGGSLVLTFPNRVKVWDVTNPASPVEIVSGTPRTVTAGAGATVIPLKVEGMFLSAAKNDIQIAASFTPTGGTAAQDSAKLTVAQTDIDADSDNDDAFNTPEADKDEGVIEEDASLDGKFLQVNDGDVDGDTLTDLIDFNGTTGGKFVPMPTGLGGVIDYANARLKFVYAGSDPAALVGGQPALGFLRLWTKNATQSRNTASVASGGDYIPVSNTDEFSHTGSFTASQIGIGSSQHQVTLWAEGVRASTTDAERTVYLYVDADGDAGPAGYHLYDQTQFRVVERGFGAWVIDNNNPGGSSSFTTGTWANDNINLLGKHSRNRTQSKAVPGGSVDAATWTFAGLQPGTYQVSATWLAKSGFATNAPFSIYDGTTLLTTVRVDQTQDATGLPNKDSANWKILGTNVTISGNSLVVKLTDDANNTVAADAVRIERVTGSDTTAPAAPSTPGGQSHSSSQINLDWADSAEPDLAGYRVYRSTTSGFTPGPANLITTNLVTASQFADTGLSANTTYYYRVAAVDTSGNESQASAEISATTQVSGLPTVNIAATDAEAAEQGPGTATFTITRSGSTNGNLTVFYARNTSSDATSEDYQALSGSVTINDGQSSAAFTLTPVDDSSVEGDEAITFLLVADSAYGIGTTASATATIDDNDTSSGGFVLSGNAVSSENIQFSWTTVVGAAEYLIEISSDGSDFFGSSLIEPGLTTYEFSGFDPGESFIFRAIALSASGTQLAQSNQVPVTMPGTSLGGTATAPTQPTTAPTRRIVVGFNGMFLDDVFESVGNQWFERNVRDIGDSLRTGQQKTYNYFHRNLALSDLYISLDTDTNKIITQQEVDAAKVIVLGFSLGGVEAANYAAQLAKTGNIKVTPPGGPESVYDVQVAVRVNLLATLDPVTGGLAFIKSRLRLPKGRISGNVGQFVNYYQTKGFDAHFFLYLRNSSNNGANFNQLFKIPGEQGEETLTSPASRVINGVPLKHNLPANKVKQLKLNDPDDVPGGRFASDVQYWRDEFGGPIAPDDYDADLKAETVEHLSLPWYVRGHAGAGFDPLVNLFNDIGLV
ncbi:MAG: fibronectin type III domain-containing protein [Tepidisphaeraceae bacterium]